MMKHENYHKYSLEKLNDALKTLDEEAYSGQKQLIKDRIQLKEKEKKEKLMRSGDFKKWLLVEKSMGFSIWLIGFLFIHFVYVKLGIRKFTQTGIASWDKYFDSLLTFIPFAIIISFVITILTIKKEHNLKISEIINILYKPSK